MSDTRKLVRDRIPELLSKDLRSRCYQLESKQEKMDFLIQKLEEEVAEYFEAYDKSELVDIIEVVYALAALHGWSQEELRTVQQRKVALRGSFSEFWVMPIFP